MLATIPGVVFDVLPVTGVLMFDYFFSLVLAFGVIGFGIGCVMHVIRRGDW